MNKEKILSFWRQNRVLILILAGSFLASVVYSFHFRINPAVDARAYDNIAQNIVSGNGYREHLTGELANDFAIARVGPLYEYFLAGIYKIFGHSHGVVWFWQALLHSLSAWFVYLTALLVFVDNDKRKKIGLIAAVIFGFYPDLIEISAMLMTETLYLFLVCLMIYLFFLYLSKGGNWRPALLGLSSGLATLARPPVLFLIPVILFYFWRQKLWRPALLFLVVLILVFMPWTVRNYQVYGQFMPFGAAGQFNFWIGNYHGGSGEQEPTVQHQQFLETHKAVDINSESMEQFKGFVFNYPAEFLKLTLLRMNKYISVIRPMGFWFYQKGLGQFLFIFSSAAASIILFVSGLGGAIKSFMEHKERFYYLLALTIATPLIIFITVVETRYRFQVYPLLSIFAGYFFTYLFSGRKWLLDKVLLLSIALIFTNGLIDLLLSFAKLKERLGLFF